jgi:chemotaxis protein methyltransferase WspC
MKRIERLLRDTIGLDAATIGSTLIERTVRLRMKHHGLQTTEHYQRLVETSDTEWDQLMESVIVTETWFFRDRAAFAALGRLVREQWLPAHPTAPLRLLSVPCASGEEPYSLVMALLDAGVPPGRFQIDAADISTRALTTARAAVYGKNSFRGKDLAFRDRYFQPTKQGFLLNPAIRNKVQFYQGNIFSPDFLAGPARRDYDFIFCRNLLIYFDRPTQEMALERINRLLAPPGVLFVGSAELPLALQQGFVSANLPMAFACVRAEGSSRTSQAHQPPLNTPLPSPVPIKFTVENKPRLEASPQGAATQLEKGRVLADAGRLQEAAGVCEAYLRDHGPSAQAYYLLGLVREAAGDPRALDCYRKAIYLEPNHYETLLQMALLSQKDGDTARARTFKARARRIKQSVNPSILE